MFSQLSQSINIRILRKIEGEKSNVRNKSTALLKFLEMQYQGAFHLVFKVTIIAKCVKSAQVKMKRINCVLREANFRVRF